AIAASLGMARRQVEYWHDSEALWQRSLACLPEYWMSKLALGDLRRQERKYAEAVELYSAVARDKPTDPEGQYKLGIAWEGLERYREAQRQYEAVLQLNPKHEGARSNLVALYKKQGKLSLDPNDAASRNQYGLALARLGETEEAARHFQEAVR